MQPRAGAVLKAVQDLLASGLSGQLRRGDSLGVWTFNEELSAGRFPLRDSFRMHVIRESLLARRIS